VLTFVTFKWKPFPGYRSTFSAEHVNVLANMVLRHYAGPHRFVLVTDDPRGVDPRIEVVPLWTDHANLMSPHGQRFPSCYRRLKIFSAEAAELLGGGRFVMLDLDSVIVDDIAPLVDREDDFIAWGGTNHDRGGYNCSFVLLRAGTRTKVWDEFNPKTSPQRAKANGCVGSDQGWLTYSLGRAKEPRFTKEDGVYSYRLDIAPNHGALPGNARVVFFHGGVDPWSPVAQRLAWVREHWR